MSRPFIKSGRYLGRAYLSLKPEIMAQMNEALEEAKKEAGLDG